jgi:hypothetical protein
LTVLIISLSGERERERKDRLDHFLLVSLSHKVV